MESRDVDKVVNAKDSAAEKEKNKEKPHIEKSLFVVQDTILEVPNAESVSNVKTLIPAIASADPGLDEVQAPQVSDPVPVSPAP